MACVLPSTMAGEAGTERRAGGESGCASRSYYAIVRPPGQQKNKCIDDDTSVTPVIPSGSIGPTKSTAETPARIGPSVNRLPEAYPAPRRGRGSARVGG